MKPVAVSRARLGPKTRALWTTVYSKAMRAEEKPCKEEPAGGAENHLRSGESDGTDMDGDELRNRVVQ